jgi:hypothetical protein
MAKRKAKKKTNRIKLACQLVQLFARLRGTDRNGYGRCVSCGKMLSWSETQGGHWHPKTRGYNAACLVRENVNIQDASCNLFKGGNTAPYTEYMLSHYGKDVIDEITAMSKRLLTPEEVENEIVSLKQMCKLLAARKNFKVRIP